MREETVISETPERQVCVSERGSDPDKRAGNRYRVSSYEEVEEEGSG